MAYHGFKKETLTPESQSRWLPIVGATFEESAIVFEEFQSKYVCDMCQLEYIFISELRSEKYHENAWFCQSFQFKTLIFLYSSFQLIQSTEEQNRNHFNHVKTYENVKYATGKFAKRNVIGNIQLHEYARITSMWSSVKKN